MGWIIGIIVAVIFLSAYVFAVLPNLSRKKETMEFTHWNYAHRGLWDEEKGIPENSIPAFRRAADAGFGIELDVHLTRDRQLVVFHDNSLERMCGVDQKIEECTLEELRRQKLGSSKYGIPLLSEVLETVNGRVPLLIEIKMPGKDPYVCAELERQMEQYSGTYCMESFNSLALRWFRENRPDVIRGQLSTKFRARDGQSFFLRFLARGLMLNFVGRPDFIAYDHRYADCMGFLINRVLCRIPAFAWTIRSQAAYDRCRKNHFDTVIFEQFLPKKQKKKER